MTVVDFSKAVAHRRIRLLEIAARKMGYQGSMDALVEEIVKTLPASWQAKYREALAEIDHSDHKPS